MHIETKPKDWYMPVASTAWAGARWRSNNAKPFTLQPGQTMQSLRVIVSLHHGDFFEPLALYRDVSDRAGCRPGAAHRRMFRTRMVFVGLRV